MSGPAATAAPAPARWRWGMALCVVAALAPGHGAAAAQPRDALVTAIKAAFLAKFPLYVTWPQRAYPSPASPFVICVVDDDGFADLVERAAAGQSQDGRPMQVRRLPVPASPAGCQILYVAADSPGLRPQLAAAAGQPVLTVTDSVRNADAKGILNFVIADNRVRFEIDAAAAVDRELSVSSKLLSLALKSVQ